MKNKILLIIIALFLISATAVSQSINYAYDNAGNRTFRMQSSITPIPRTFSGERSAVNSSSIGNLVYTTPGNYALNESLPVGSTPYTFKVNANGSSAFTIPLSLPQGQAGMTPELSITYNSLAGEGVLGYGMNLSCISSITRNGKRSFYDGSNSAVSFTNAIFELDGIRLIKNGSSNNYLKEIDDFSRITLHNGTTGNPQYFVVQQKNGGRLYYGDYNGTNAFQKSSSNTAYIAWYLAAQEDVHGNYISYQYEQDLTNGDVWLTSITYTLHASHNFAHENKILLNYQRYVDAQSGYISGCQVKRDKILREITVKTDATVMRRYTFDYLKPTDEYTNQYPRLYTITEYGEGGTEALNPMRIEWGDTGKRLFNASYTYSQNSEFVQGDFNGDGCMDLLTIYDLSTENKSAGAPRDYLVVYRYGNPNGFSNELTMATFSNQYKPLKAVAGDFNGDGLDDLFFSTSSGYEYWQASLSNNNVPNFTKQSYKPSVSTVGTPNIVAMADVNGDGKDELVIDNVYFKDGYTTGTRYTLSQFSVFYTYMIGDVDGDGCQDIIVCDDGGTVKVCSPAKNAVILERSFARNYMLGPNCVLLCGYFNDDRYLDFLLLEGYNEVQPNNSQANIYYNTGDGKNFTYQYISNKFTNNKYNSFRTGDFNGDGLTDVICVGSDNIASCMESQTGYVSGGDWVYINYAPDFNTRSSSLEYDLYLSQETGGTPGKEGVYTRDGKYYIYPSYFYPIAADFSGDGKCDLVNVCEFRSHPFDSSHPSWLTGSTSLKLLCPSHQSTSDVVTGIKNGDGTKRDIDYQLVTTASRDPKFYNGNYASWNKDIPTFNTVSTVKLGSLFDTSLVENKKYTYTSPVYAMKDRWAFQGFRTVTCQDLISGDKMTDVYSLISYSGYPYYYQSSDRRESEAVYLSRDYWSSFKSTYGKYGFFYITVCSVADRLKGIDTNISYAYDASGNLTSRSTSYRGGTEASRDVSETMSYVSCANVSSFPCRMSGYKKTFSCSGVSIVGEEKTFGYNSYGDLLTETEHGMTKRYSYDATLGLLTSETVSADGKARTHSYEYDDARYVKKDTDPVGLVTQVVQDFYGNPLSETAPDGRTATYQYDTFGRLKKSLSHEQVPTEYRYSWTGHSVTGTSASLYRQQKFYDGVLTSETTVDCYGRTLLQSELQPGSKWQHLRSSYNAIGLPVKEETLCGNGALSLLATVDYTYDGYQRLTQEDHRSADGTTLNKQVYHTYNKQTETHRTVTDKESTETFVYDAQWNIVSQSDATGTTTYTYDAAGRVVKVSSPGYPVTSTYNTYGLCTSVSNAASGTTTYTYNGFDELATKRDANDNVTTYTYDLAGRLVSVADGERTLSYTYNNKGQLINNGVSGHQSAYTYTTAGLLQKEVKTIKDQALTKSYTYDSKGRLLTYTSPSGLVQKFGYDASHNLISITDNATSVKLWEAKSYNDQGLLTSDVNCGNKQTTYTYDQLGKYKGISNSLATFSYQYNRGGLLTQRIEKFGGSGLTETFAYDAEGCLLSSTLSGKTPVTVSYNSGRTIKAKSDIGSYSYNASGAPLSAITPISGYSSALQQVNYYKNNLPSAIVHTGCTREYEYGADNLRDYSVLTVSSSTVPFAAGKRYYFDDFERNINTGNGAVSDLDYIFADGRLVALVRTSGGSKTCYGVLTDRLGSLMSLYTSGGIVQKFSYDAWGNRRDPLTGVVLSSSELASANSITSYGYTGHEHIDEFGLINMNARIYDPKIGMFISVDPQAGSYPGTYPYTYCGGDPVNRVDPTGEDWYEDQNGNLYWQEGDKDLDGYSRLGASISFPWGEGRYFNAYQNAGIIANQAVKAFDLIYISHKLQNQFLGKDSPLSEMSKSELSNALRSRSMDAIARPIGEAIVEIGAWQLGGALLSDAIAWGVKGFSQFLGKSASAVVVRGISTGTSLWPAASNGRTIINGIEYTSHALERMQPVGTVFDGVKLGSRGIPPSAVENAIKYGNVTPGRTINEVVRTFENVQVVTNPQGTRVITVVKLGH